MAYEGAHGAHVYCRTASTSEEGDIPSEERTTVFDTSIAQIIGVVTGLYSTVLR